MDEGNVYYDSLISNNTIVSQTIRNNTSYSLQLPMLILGFSWINIYKQFCTAMLCLKCNWGLKLWWIEKFYILRTSNFHFFVWKLVKSCTECIFFTHIYKSNVRVVRTLLIYLEKAYFMSIRRSIHSSSSFLWFVSKIESVYTPL